MRKEKWLLLALVVLKFSLPFILSNPVYELHRDEYLYYEQGQHLALGYLENPPLIGLLGAISSLLGGSYFWIKFWPALFGVLTLWITVKLVAEFGGTLYAQLVAALGLLFTAYLRTHFLFQPNFFDVFFWTLSAFYLTRYINTKSTRYIFLLAISLAVGWYGKYSILFFIVALLGGLLLTHHRIIFTKKAFWMALLLGSLLILPNVLWQYFHNWPLLHHMQELQETQLQHLSKADFIKEQVLMLFPVLLVWVGGLIWLLRQKAYRIIAIIYFLIVLLLMMGSGKGYYALGAYPMLLAAGGVWAERLTRTRRWLQVSFVLLLILLSLPVIPLLLPLQQPEAMAQSNKKYNLEKLGILRWEDGQNHPLQQDYADMLGWKELTGKTEAYFNKLPDTVRRQTLVYCANYGLAGSMKYYAKEKTFRDKIISENGTFLLWIPDGIKFKHLLFIDDEEPETDDSVLKYFTNRQVVDSCNNIYSRQFGTKIYHFRNASDSARIIFEQDLQKTKAVFRR